MRALAAIFCFTACSNGTFALVHLSAVNGGAGVKSIDLVFSLGSSAATQKLSDGGGEIAFPTSATFRLHHTGSLGVMAIARDQDGKELARGNGMGEIATGKTTPIDLVLDFGMTSADLAGVDLSGVDLSSVALPDLTGAILPPRPLWPQDFSSVTSVRPTLKWELPAGSDGARVELCRDRACTLVLQTLDAAGSSITVPSNLPAVYTQVYWRMTGLANNVAGTIYSPTWTFRTPFAGAPVDTSFGISFDANGDGIDDLPVGAAAANLAGTVFVFYGTSAGLPTPSPQAVAEPAGGASDFFGAAVAAAGDVDGDGYGDLIVGAPGSGPFDPAPAPGHAWVFFGSPSGISTTRAPVRLDVIATDVKNQFNTGPQFGISVGTAGDVDADGYADVMVGAGYDILPGFPGTGKAFLFRGGPNGPITTPASVLIPVGPAAYLGSSVGEAGDVNGDGFSDVLVSSYGGGGVGANDGFTYLYLGGAGGLGPLPSPASIFEGATNDVINTAAGGGDFDADGYADFAVGAHGNSKVYLFRGGAVSPSPSPFKTLPPASCATSCPIYTSGENFGWSLAMARNLLVIGSPCAPRSPPVTTCGPGAASIWSSLTSATPMGVSLTRVGGNNGDGFGGATAIGDYNGDTNYDFAASAANVGLVFPYLVIDAAGNILDAPVLSDGSSSDGFGYSL